MTALNTYCVLQSADDDYENITMMNMRRAAERQRLIAQMAEDDAKDEN